MEASRRPLPAALPVDAHVEASHLLQLDPSPRLVSTARTFVRDHVPGLPAETVDVLLLLTSELVTNAVIHARTPLEVGVVLTDRCVLVTVHDLDLHRPSQQPYTDREGGWGLSLVDALAEDHATEPHPDGGKTAWFRIVRGDSPSVADDAALRPDTRSDRVEAEG